MSRPKVFGLHRETVSKMLRYSVPPGYRRNRPPRRPKLDPLVWIIDRILEKDRLAPRKQRHTAKRIFERLRQEYGFEGSYTIVKDYVREHRRRSREVFVPLAHDPGHAQVDFGEALAVIAGIERKVHFFAMDLPHSDACFVKGYERKGERIYHVPSGEWYDRMRIDLSKGEQWFCSEAEARAAGSRRAE